MYYWTSASSYNCRRCGGQNVYCDGCCTNCERAEIVYSTRNQTDSSSFQIHIVKKPE